jgi:hypothetical protein
VRFRSVLEKLVRILDLVLIGGEAVGTELAVSASASLGRLPGPRLRGAAVRLAAYSIEVCFTEVGLAAADFCPSKLQRWLYVCWKSDQADVELR